VPDDPFAVLGLPVRRDLTDEDVRAAWRRIAAVTHPDLADGGDPGRYSAAAAAYDTLRTSFGRGEALADLGLSGISGTSRRPRRGMHRGGVRAGQAPSLRAGRPRITRRTALCAGIVAAAAIAVAVAGWTPATIALLAGAATWLLTEWGRWRWGG
jgi:curved DNA-binding protein CbpA